MTDIKIQLLHKDAKLPHYATVGAAGMDLYSIEDVTILPGRRYRVRTGIAVEIPYGFELQCRPRSGLALKEGLTVLNAPGTIDSDYRGELGVILINHGKTSSQVHKGDRIAQLVLAPVVHARLVQVDALSSTVRGEGGFGSTGL